MTTRPTIPPLSDTELQLLSEAGAVQQLRDSPAFKKVYSALTLSVEAALNDLRLNTNPHADAYYKLIWTSRLELVNALDQYIDNTIQKRRDTLQEFMRSLGIAEEKIQRNLDNDLEFLLRPGGPNVNHTR